MNLIKKITNKLVNTSQLNDDLVNVNTSVSGLVYGWAVKLNNLSAQLTIEIKSKSNQVCVIANVFRPDVANLAEYGLGHCGFSCDISDWECQEVSVKVLGVLAKNTQAEPTGLIMFVHIPKTAGTSFKDAAIKYVGNGLIAKNYGKASPESTPWISETLLKNNNYSELYRRLKENKFQFYMGHMHAMPAALVIPIRQVMTIMRDPIAQVISHYNHHVRWLNYEGSVVDYIKSAAFKNMQSRILSPLPVSLIGFIGITEDYNNSIDIFNRMHGYQLKTLQSNVNTVKEIEIASDDVTALIHKHNTADIKLYDYAYDVHRRRLLLEEQGNKWCFGAIKQRTKSNITGYACWHHNQSVVILQLVAEGKVVQELQANQHCPTLCQFNPPRNSFIGFNFKFSNFNSNDLTVVVKGSDQELKDEFV
jgi:hypothetical protein